MGLMLLRAFAAIATLIIVPFVVNIKTGGQAPEWVGPYDGWLWPVVFGCVVLVIGIEAWERRRRRATMTSSRRPDLWNQKLALAQIARYVDGRQRAAVGVQRGRLAITLDEQPSCVRQPAHLLRRPPGSNFVLSPELAIADVFDEFAKSMLILGPPGSGKTTQLLDLAAALVDRAQMAQDQPIPVLLDLADWSRSGVRRFSGLGADRGPREFVPWLLTSLRQRYGITEAIGRRWLEQDQLAILLDGLDEVREGDRERCVREINLLPNSGVTGVAVSSRTADYLRLSNSLELQGAVGIKPLTGEQVTTYLNRVDAKLAGVIAALGGDKDLEELLTTPLMLNILIDVKDSHAWRAVSESSDSVHKRQLLFDAYVTEMLARPRGLPEPDTSERLLSALQALAAASIKADAGIRTTNLTKALHVQGLSSPSLNVIHRWLSPVGLAMSFLAAIASMSGYFGVTTGVIVAFLNWGWFTISLCLRIPSRAAFRPGILLLYIVLLAAAVVGLVVGSTYLAELLLTQSSLSVAIIALTLTLTFPAVLLSWDRTDLMGTLREMKWWIAWGLAVTAVLLVFGATPAALQGWAFGLTQGFSIFFFGFIDGGETQVPAEPPTEALRAWRPQLVLYSLASLAILFIFTESWAAPVWPALAGWAIGLFHAPAVFVAVARWRGQLGRAAMIIAGEPNPWRQQFLRFAADRGVLSYIDGKYRWVHLLLRDHLASCDPVKLASDVSRRRTELGVSPTGSE